MTNPKIEERTLYPPLIGFLNQIGIEAVGETKVTSRSPDILFKVDSIYFVIEVKIGKPEKGLKAVAQAYDYAKKLDTDNIVILVYDEKYRNEIADPENVKKVALEMETQVLVLTENWMESMVIKPEIFFQRLKDHIITKKRKIDFKTTIELIEEYVRDLNAIIYQKVTNELISEVVNKLDLFSAIGEIKNKKTAENQVINLASYLLFNQLLFYHIFNKKSKKYSLPELDEVNSIEEIQKYFNKIKKIDYHSIYKINILGHIPNKKIIVETINEAIKAINLLRAEYITHDLAGRFFHDLIPFEVRKVLAAFYTHPNAADLLTSFTIDSFDEKVIDPACGSGTLLVSSYKRKMILYNKLHGYDDLNSVHKNFIENELTGIDIMPFAAHISAINLTMQNIEQETNKVRIATFDSLEMVKLLKTAKFKRSGIKVSPYSTQIQLTIDGVFGKPVKIDKKGAVSAEGKGAEFFLKPQDNVIMNPPFSQREKMPIEMRDKLKENPLKDICGNSVNLWGYFLAIADLFLRKNGKIGAVIPINIARGNTTKDIRDFLLEHYHIKHIIKTTKDLAFSEGAAFRDILLIAEKKKPLKKDKTTIWFLNKSIVDLTSDDIQKFLDHIEGENELIMDLFSRYSLLQSDLKTSFMRSIALSSLKINKVLNSAYKKISIIGKLRKITNDDLKEGFGFRPKGISKVIVIANPISDKRTSRSDLILKEEKKNTLIVDIKSLEKQIEIKRTKLVKGFRSLTGIDILDITNESDFIITEAYKYSDLLMNTYMDKKIDWEGIKDYIKRLEGCHCFVPDKLNITSPNTHLISALSESKLIPSNMFYLFKTQDLDEAKINVIFFNSILTILQFVLNKPETLGSYFRLKMSDWNKVYIPDLEKLKENEKKKIIEIFNKFKGIEFPPILKQLKERDANRVALDKLILEIFGFNKREISEWLPDIYDAIVEELETMKNLK